MAKSSTSFKPGQSGNPGGRRPLPADAKKIIELAKSWSTAAIETAADVLNSRDASPQAKIAAASLILDRGLGRPGTTMDITSKGEGLQIGSFIVEGK